MLFQVLQAGGHAFVHQVAQAVHVTALGFEVGNIDGAATLLLHRHDLGVEQFLDVLDLVEPDIGLGKEDAVIIGGVAQREDFVAHAIGGIQIRAEKLAVARNDIAAHPGFHVDHIEQDQARLANDFVLADRIVVELFDLLVLAVNDHGERAKGNRNDAEKRQVQVFYIYAPG